LTSSDHSESSSNSDSGSTISDSNSDEPGSSESSDESTDEESCNSTKRVQIEKGKSATTLETPSSDLSSLEMIANEIKAAVGEYPTNPTNVANTFISSSEDPTSQSQSSICGAPKGPSTFTVEETLNPKSPTSISASSTDSIATVGTEQDSHSTLKRHSPVNITKSPSQCEMGWGDEPGPAQWDWKEMPFDYMGILEEQHRTVFYEYRERGDGKGEWKVPQYEGIDSESGFDVGPPDYKEMYEKDPESVKVPPTQKKEKKQFRRRRWNRLDDFDYVRSPAPARRVLYEPGDGEFNRGIVSRKFGTKKAQGATSAAGHLKRRAVPRRDGNGISSCNHSDKGKYPQKNNRSASTRTPHSIIDAPEDAFDLAGLMSPRPERPSLPIIEPKTEIKRSSAWTKEGKRKREMSTLILPRPEKVTWPAAIYHDADKRKIGLVKKIKTRLDAGATEEKGQSNGVNSKLSADISEMTLGDVAKNVPTPSVEVFTAVSTVAPLSSSSSSDTPAEAPTTNIAPTIGNLGENLDSAQLLLQLINLLRSDDKALNTLTTLVSAVKDTPSESTKSRSNEPSVPVKHPKDASDIKQTPIDTLPIIAIQCEAKPEGTNSAKSDNVLSEENMPKAGVEEAKVEEEALASQPAVLIYPAKKHKSHKHHSSSAERSHKAKTRKLSREGNVSDNSEIRTRLDQEIFSASSIVAEPLRQKKPPIESSSDEDLAREGLWYSVSGGKNSPDFETDEQRYTSTAVYRPHTVNEAGPTKSHPVRQTAARPNTATVSTEMKTKSIYGGSNEIYERTFAKVDANDDLGVVSKPLNSADIESISQVETSMLPKASSPPQSPSYDFNPPAPRRVTRRVILRSKEVATQTSPRSSSLSPTHEVSVEELSDGMKARRPAIHHPRYYNTLPRDHISKTQTQLKRPVTLTPEKLASLPKGWTGSDDIWIGTQKNVDADDEDLGIVSKPKEAEPEPKVEEKRDHVDDTVAKLAKTIAGLEKSGLKALLKALSNAPAVEPPPVEKKAKKDKEEKKERKARKAEEKARKKEEKAKPKKIHETSASDEKRAEERNSGMGDLIGDLIGDSEIPKWNILSPSP